MLARLLLPERLLWLPDSNLAWPGGQWGITSNIVIYLELPPSGCPCLLLNTSLMNLEIFASTSAYLEMRVENLAVTPRPHLLLCHKTVPGNTPLTFPLVIRCPPDEGDAPFGDLLGQLGQPVGIHLLIVIRYTVRSQLYKRENNLSKFLHYCNNIYR